MPGRWTAFSSFASWMISSSTTPRTCASSRRSAEDPGYINRVNPAYTVLDLGLEVDLGRAVANLSRARRVALQVRVNNLTDQLYTTFGYFDGYQPVWIPGRHPQRLPRRDVRLVTRVVSEQGSTTICRTATADVGGSG